MNGGAKEKAQQPGAAVPIDDIEANFRRDKIYNISLVKVNTL